MKKLLLMTALATGALCSYAEDYTDYFKVTYNGEEIASGSTIECNSYEEVLGELNFTAHVKVVSQLSYSFPLYGDLTFVEGDNNAQPQLCFSTLSQDYINGEWIFSTNANCLAILPNAVTIYPEYLENGTASDFEWQAEAIHAATEGACTLQLKFCACSGDEDEYEILEDTYFTLNINYSPDNAAVESIGAVSTEAPVYYNLNGVKVENPDNGVFIMKQGDKVSKVNVRK